MTEEKDVSLKRAKEEDETGLEVLVQTRPNDVLGACDARG
jgi:hypothetical protein